MKRLRQSCPDIGPLEADVLQKVVVQLGERDDLPTDARSMDQTVECQDEGRHVSFPFMLPVLSKLRAKV
jgi:hypothetical protein